MRLLVVCLFGLTALYGQDEWSRIGQLARDQKVEVLRFKNTEVRGRFVEWTPERLAIRTGRQEQVDFARPEVDRVWAQEKGKRWKAALIGLGVGFAIGFTVGAASAGYVADENTPSFGTRMGVGLAFGSFFGGVGAGVGAATGGSTSRLIYRAPRR